MSGGEPARLRESHRGAPEELFKATPEPEGYFIFRHASHSAHTSRVALEATKVYSEDGTVQISFGGSPGNVLRVGIQAGQVFLVGYHAAVELLGWDTLDAVKSFHGYAHDELTRLADLAQIGGVDEFLSDKGVEAVAEQADRPKVVEVETDWLCRAGF